MAFNFGDAIYAMLHGRKVARSGWNGKDMYIALQMPDENSKMTQLLLGHKGKA